MSVCCPPRSAGGMRPPPGHGMPPHPLMLQQGKDGGGMSDLQKLVNMHPDMTPEAMRSQAQVAATIAAVQVRESQQNDDFISLNNLISELKTCAVTVQSFIFMIFS